MKFILLTEKGSQIEFDTEQIKEAVISFDGVDYKISIQKLGELE